MCTILTADGGTSSPHSASTIASTDTVRLTSSSRRASSARALPAGQRQVRPAIGHLERAEDAVLRHPARQVYG